MRKPVLLAAGAGVLALLGGLLFMLRADPHTMPATPAPPAPVADQPGMPTGTPTPKDPLARRAPDGTGPIRVQEPGTVTDHRPGIDPMRITRDHRGEENKAARSPITPDTVALTRNTVTPIIKTCAEPLAAAGKKGTLLVTVTASSQGGKVSFKDVKVKQKDIDDQALVDCVTKAYTSMVMDAPEGQGDAEYKLAMPFPVP